MAASSASAAMAAAARTALLRKPPVLRAPALARGKFQGESDNYGRIRTTGAANIGGRSRQVVDAVPSRPGTAATPLAAMPVHHQALRRISEHLTGGLADLAGGPLQALRERSVNLRRRGDQAKQEEVFEASRRFLMEPETWTYGNMAAYQRKVLELAGATGWRRRLSQDDPSILHLEKELRVLEAMTPVELSSNHKAVFTPEAKKLIAEKAGTTATYVDQVIMEHDILRADRRWYKIRLQFNKPLPKSFEDRQFMGEYDRPFSESEIEYQQDMIERQRLKTDRKRPPRLFNIYYRTPTCGGNRWSTRPPRWYPVNWKMRPERRDRLAGVGVPGGGGDRGRPWGRLAAFVGQGGEKRPAAAR